LWSVLSKVKTELGTKPSEKNIEELEKDEALKLSLLVRDLIDDDDDNDDEEDAIVEL
jgi:hypothetical protein